MATSIYLIRHWFGLARIQTPYFLEEKLAVLSIQPLCSVHKGDPFWLCRLFLECFVVCHPKCAMNLPASCGLPTEYVSHFAEVMQSQSSSHISTVDLRLTMSSWMKIPRWTRTHTHSFINWDGQPEGLVLAERVFILSIASKPPGWLFLWILSLVIYRTLYLASVIWLSI